MPNREPQMISNPKWRLSAHRVEAIKKATPSGINVRITRYIGGAAPVRCGTDKYGVACVSFWCACSSIAFSFVYEVFACLSPLGG